MIVLAGILAAGSTAFAQTVGGNTDDDTGVSATPPFVSESTLDGSDARPDVSLPIVPIRDWQVDGMLLAPQTSRQMGRSFGAVPRIPRLPQPTRARPRSPAYKGAQRILAGVAMGTLGMVIGTAGGALMGSVGCGGCEDGAMYGMALGAPIGAAAGATLGVLLTR
jgi:hypothetical protein